MADGDEGTVDKQRAQHARDVVGGGVDGEQARVDAAGLAVAAQVDQQLAHERARRLELHVELLGGDVESVDVDEGQRRVDGPDIVVVHLDAVGVYAALAVEAQADVRSAVVQAAQHADELPPLHGRKVTHHIDRAEHSPAFTAWNLSNLSPMSRLAQS